MRKGKCLGLDDLNMLKKFSFKHINFKQHSYFGFGLLTVVLIWILVCVPYLPHNLKLRQGEVATRTIISPKTIQLQTTSDLENAKVSTSFYHKSFDKVYVVDDVISQGVLHDIQLFFDAIRLFHTDIQEVSDANQERLTFLPDQVISFLKKTPLDRLEEIEYSISKRAANLLNQGINTTDLSSLSLKLDANNDIWKLSKEENELSHLLLLHYLKPNLVFSPQKTKGLLLKQRQNNTAVTLIREGETIVYKGESITKQHIEIFEALGIYGVRPDWSRLAGISLVVILLLLLLERFVFYFNPRIRENPKNLALIFLLMVGGVFNALIVSWIGQFPFYIDPRFLIPIPIAAMLISLLLRTNISMLSGTVLSILIAIIFKFDLSVFIFLFLSNSVTLFLAYKKYSRRELILVGYFVGIFNMLFIVTLGLMDQETHVGWYLSNALVSFMNGVLSSMVCMAIMPYLENIFNITTRQTLLDFSNLNHPLLKQLMISAPGTYQHSLMVAILAEAAAEAIQADPIVCRVGAYFHDIGKIKRPLFFTENQLNGVNPHDGMSPKLSKMIIASHVKDGVELAQKYKLPDVIKDIIQEHHGTTMVSFFFIQAMHNASQRDADVIEDDFRYPGPKPHFKEAGIVMLADSVEAATRSMEKPSYSKVENMVDKIFHGKIDSEQFDQCPLSLSELKIIKDVFLSLFKGIYHSRLDYQEELSHILAQHQKDKNG